MTFNYSNGKPAASRGRKAMVSERSNLMHSLTLCVRNFLKNEDGPTAVEYAVMLALIIVVCILSITALGTNANKVFSNVALNTAVTAS
jgi:pilus assembly protein Flp/PilA